MVAVVLKRSVNAINPDSLKVIKVPESNFDDGWASFIRDLLL